MEPGDRAALDRLKQDQKYRDWVNAHRRAWGSRVTVAATAVAALAGVAGLLRDWIHLF